MVKDGQGERGGEVEREKERQGEREGNQYPLRSETKDGGGPRHTQVTTYNSSPPKEKKKMGQDPRVTHFFTC